MADSVSTLSITNLDATPALRPVPAVHGGGLKSYAGTAEGTPAAAAGSNYRMFRVASWQRPRTLSYSVDALSVGAIDIGLCDTAANGGALVAKSLFASTFSTDTAKTNQGVLKPAGDIANVEKRIWELLGLTSDPDKLYDVTITVVTATGNAGTHTLQGDFSQ